MEKTKEELIELFEEYLNETGNYYDFISWLKDRGETPEDCGFEEDEC